MSNDWLKLHSRGWLHGSIRVQLSPAERGVWADLLCLANESRVRGVVCRAKGIPYTREYLASLLDIPLELLNSTIEKCVKDQNADDPRTRLMFDEYGCILIANWEKYQAKPAKEVKEKMTDGQLEGLQRRLDNLHPEVSRSVLERDWGMKVVKPKRKRATKRSDR